MKAMAGGFFVPVVAPEDSGSAPDTETDAPEARDTPPQQNEPSTGRAALDKSDRPDPGTSVRTDAGGVRHDDRPDPIVMRPPHAKN